MERPFKDVRPVGPFAQSSNDKTTLNFGLVVENRTNLPVDTVIKSSLKRAIPAGIVRDVETIEPLQDIVVIKTSTTSMSKEDIEGAFDEIRQYAENNNANVEEIDISTNFQ